MEEAPQDEGPVGAVPQSADQEHDHRVDVGEQLAFAGAAQGDVDVLGEKFGEGHVPSLPEISDRDRLVGRVKIHRQIDAEHGRYADGHIAVAAEVKIDLERVEQHKQHAIHGGGGLQVCVDPRHTFGEGIRDEDFLDESEAEYFDTGGELVDIDALSRFLIDLGDEVDRVDDRAHDELGKIQDVSQVVDQALVRQLAALRRDDVGDLLEGVKGDSEGQDDLLQREFLAEHKAHIRDGKIQILEIEQKTDIDCNRNCHHEALVNGELPDQERGKVVDEHADPEIEKHVDSSVRIEENARGDEHELARKVSAFSGNTVGCKVQQYHYRQKYKYKAITVKLHDLYSKFHNLFEL